MWNKIIEVLGSMRFWQLVIGAVLLILAQYGVVPAELATTLAGFLGISIVVRTVDKFN